jgi:Tfp pilus assembly protein PilV
MKTREKNRRERPVQGGRVRLHRKRLAFTLLEVMIAAAIFFMGMFALLRLLSAGLHSAAILQKNAPTAGMAVAQLTLTNKLEEMSQTGDFGELYPDYRWELYPHEILTNGLFQVDVKVYHQSEVFSTMSILLFRPDSQKSF